jgi:hypothetical protein
MQGTTGLRLNSNAELKARSLKAAATKPEASVAATFRSRDVKETNLSRFDRRVRDAILLLKSYIPP